MKLVEVKKLEEKNKLDVVISKIEKNSCCILDIIEGNKKYKAIVFGRLSEALLKYGKEGADYKITSNSNLKIFNTNYMVCEGIDVV